MVIIKRFDWFERLCFVSSDSLSNATRIGAGRFSAFGCLLGAHGSKSTRYGLRARRLEQSRWTNKFVSHCKRRSKSTTIQLKIESKRGMRNHQSTKFNDIIIRYYCGGFHSTCGSEQNCLCSKNSSQLHAKRSEGDIKLSYERNHKIKL